MTPSCSLLVFLRLHLGPRRSSVLTSQYSLTGAKSLDLSYQVDEFKDLCYGWKECKPEYNSISITHLRAYVFLSGSRPETAWKSLTPSLRIDLPDDVFEPGEVKPQKPSKKKAPNGIPAQKKRTATEVCPGNRLGPWLRTALFSQHRRL